MYKMYKYCFVILHYLAVDDTIECINSIQDRYMKKYNVNIVVVDNASPDNSGVVLKEMFENDMNVYVLHNNKNIGFSKGNNIGIKFAKYELSSDFIIVINNDTVLIQDEFLDLISIDYQKYSFGVLGPKVLDPQNKNISNPLYFGKIRNSKDYQQIYYMWRRLYLKSIFHLEWLHRKKMTYSSQSYSKSIPEKTYQQNVELHGCCLIFSKKFLQYFDGFEELTFMYGEETILKMNCDRYNLMLLYDQNLKIYHKEGISTHKQFSSRKKKYLYYKRMMQASKAIYLKKRELEYDKKARNL